MAVYQKLLDIPLSGKLNTADDPIKLQPNDFQELINLRPTDDSPEGVRGMTKVNSVGTTYDGIKTGYHFKKDQPSESHILVQTVDTTGTSSEIIKSDNTAVIPNQDTFNTFLDLAGNTNPCYFSKAPDGCLAVCNSTKNYIWGGTESRCNGFIVFDSNTSNTLYDYTDIINNTLNDVQNVATLSVAGGGVDAYTVACYHFENDYADSSGIAGTSHNLTAVGTSFTTASAALHAGTASLLANNTYATCDVSGDAHFDFSAGALTVSARVRYTNFVVPRAIWCLYDDANNFVELYNDANGALHLSVFTGGGEVLGTVGLVTANNTIILNTKHTVEVSRDASNNWYILVDGSLKATVVDAHNLLSTYITLRVGLGVTGQTFYGSIDELKFDKGICRHTSDYTPQVYPFSNTSVCNIYLASTRPLQGSKWYVGTANTSVATVTGTYWNGAWTALAALVDNTATAGVSLAKTGTVTWTDTQADAKVKIINNQQYYWYKFAFSGIEATTTIYHCTIDANIQPIKDIWDGSLRTCLSMMTYTTAYADFTLQIYKNDYYATDTSTYVNLHDITSTHYQIYGFSERTMALYISFAEAYVNTTAGTVCSIYYWNGSTWTTVGTLDDGTSESGISFSRSGVISWDAPAIQSEFTWTPNSGTPLYYYKVQFSQTLDNTDSKVYLNYAAGIPAQNSIHSFKFPLFWQNRLFLCGDQSGRKNLVRYSSMDTNCVYNGLDSGELPVDGDDELMAGATLFTRFGGDVYDSAILCKRGQTFLLDNDPNNTSMFLVRTVSTNKGCVAPYTMKLCDIGFDVAANIRKHILIWLSDSGLMVFDGVSMGTISDYFSNIFDSLDTNYINRTYIDKAYGEYDPVEQEYILCVPIGATPTWKELHYKLKQQSPFWVDRGTGKYLRCSFPVEDSNGNKYVYGGTDDGFIERLEFGTTMDGNAIAYTFWTADINFTKTAMRRSSVHAIQLIGRMKSTTASTITATHYVDGALVGDTSTTTISQDKTGYRIFRAYFPVAGRYLGVYHSTKFTISTNDENRGFEPLLVSYMWSDEDQVFD
jgi:hypothetical protein